MTHPVFLTLFCCFLSIESVQVSRGFLPVQHPGQLLLAAGGGHVSADAAGSDLRLTEEILLVVYPDWMGWVRVTEFVFTKTITHCSSNTNTKKHRIKCDPQTD